MDSTGEQLHPNWRALATLHVPVKRFVRAGLEDSEKGTANSQAEKYKVEGVSGTEAQQFYQEILDIPVSATSHRITRSQHESKRIKIKPQLPFDRSKFFRWATGNNVAELQQMRITAAEVNLQDNYGWTGLMMAACEGAAAAVELLLKLGADAKVSDKSGHNALALAQRKGHAKIVRLLESTHNWENKNAASVSPATCTTSTPFYCVVCQRNFHETTRRAHQTSTVHQFNEKALPANKVQKFNISAKNRGLQLMVKQGWDREHGLGPTQTGRLYPVKTVLRKQRTGLGIEQTPARVTHFGANDMNAIKRRDGLPQECRRTRNEMRREKVREWKRQRQLRSELS